MRKTFFILAMVAVLAFISTPAMATKKCPPGQERKDWKCVPIEQPVGDGISIDNKNVITNSNKNSNKNSNNNLNINLNKNSNKNSNKNVNKLDQDQGQFQGQDQGQFQGQTANNEGVDQTVVIEGDDYEAATMHISGPALLQPDVKFTEGYEFSFRVKGSYWTQVVGLSSAQAANLDDDCADCEVDKALAIQGRKAVTYITKGIPTAGEYLGNLYAFADGSDSNIAGLEGKALLAAMKAGATHAVIIYDSGIESDGSSWNIGVGGGASIVATGDGGVMLAPNGGMGFGSATARNNKLPAMVVKCYRNESAAKLFELKYHSLSDGNGEK